MLLHRCNKDYDRAEAQYKKAIELYPSHASIINFYATFLKSVRKDYEQVRWLSFGLFASTLMEGGSGEDIDVVTDWPKV